VNVERLDNLERNRERRMNEGGTGIPDERGGGEGIPAFQVFGATNVEE